MEVPLRDVPLFITEEKWWKWWRKSCVAASLIKKGGLHPRTTNVHACRHQVGVSNDHCKLISTDCWRYLWIIKVYKIGFRHAWKVDTTSLLWKGSNTWPSSDKGIEDGRQLSTLGIWPYTDLIPWGHASFQGINSKIGAVPRQKANELVVFPVDHGLH